MATVHISRESLETPARKRSWLRRHWQAIALMACFLFMVAGITRGPLTDLVRAEQTKAAAAVAQQQLQERVVAEQAQHDAEEAQAKAQAAQVATETKTKAGAGTTTIIRYSADVSPETVASFAKAVSDQEGHVIGVRASIKRQDEIDPKSRYFAFADDNNLSLSSGPTGGLEGVEVVFPAGTFRKVHGDFEVDGFFLVKNEGMQMGVVSMGMEPVATGSVEMSPNIVIKEADLH